MTEIAATGGSDRNRQWRRFVATFVGVLAGGLLTIFIAVLVIDPYDTGRLPTFMPAGTDDTQQHGNTASRGRNPKFDAAIFGNSHGQLIDPVRLSRLTGLNFVQMTTPGSGPREQLILMRYFLRQHQTVRASGTDLRPDLVHPRSAIAGALYSAALAFLRKHARIRVGHVEHAGDRRRAPPRDAGVGQVDPDRSGGILGL